MGKFSILMNCYNCQNDVKKAIESVFSQTYQNWEIIFIDNCSTDKSFEIAQSFGEKVKIYQTPKLIPLGEARNFGLKYCDGEFLAFLDTDDIWLPKKLELQNSIFQNKPDVKLIYGGAIWIDEVDNKIGELIPKFSNDYFKQNLLRYEINMQSVAIRNDGKIQFRDSHQFSPDFDLFMKIISNSKTEIIPNAIVKYRKLGNSLTSKKISRWWIETKETLDDIFHNQDLSQKYKNEKKIAYAKVGYYKAQFLISENRLKEARAELNKYKDISKTYKLLYFASFSKTLWQIIHKFK